MLDKSDWPVFASVGACAVGGIFVYCYRHASEFLTSLQSIEELDIDRNLVEKLHTAGGIIPYVAVSGKVSADGKVLSGLHSTESTGVIRNVNIKEKRQRWSSPGQIWLEEERTVSSCWSEEPFSLINRGDTVNTDNGDNVNTSGDNDTSSGDKNSNRGNTSNNIRVSVRNPRSASQLKLTKVADHYEPSQSSAGEQVLDYIKGEKVKGIRTIEKMLLSNTLVTVIGKVHLTSDGKLVISASTDDLLKYYITQDSLSTVVDNERGVAQLSKAIAILFFIIGGGFLSFYCYKRYKKYTKEMEYIHMQQEMESFDADCDDRTVCTICLDGQRNVVFLPCGHVCVCSTCSRKVSECPVCRSVIEKRSQVFFS